MAFAISITSLETGKQVFVGGYTEGSEFSITDRIQSAKWFNSYDEALAVIENHPEFNKRNFYADRSSSPPSLIWSGLDICNKRPVARGKIDIVSISFIPAFVREVKDGFIRDDPAAVEYNKQFA
jgi:hypothetical protein